MQAHILKCNCQAIQWVTFRDIANSEAPLLNAFEFEKDGLRFSCRVEAATGARKDAWWWFGVSTDDRHRYAPFRAEETDTESSVKARVLQYYADLLARRAEPVASHWRRGVRPTPAVAVAPTEPPAVAEAEA